MFQDKLNEDEYDEHDDDDGDADENVYVPI